MATRRKQSSGPGGGSPPGNGADTTLRNGPGERELIVIAAPEAGLRARGDGVASAAGADVRALSAVLEKFGGVMRPLFGVSEEQVRREMVSEAPSAGSPMHDPAGFYRVEAPDESLDELALQLQAQPAIAAAYVKPAAELAVATVRPGIGGIEIADVRVDAPINDMAPLPEDVPNATPDHTARQGYLDAAPGGIDARYAWTLAGGRGVNVRVIDLEWGWRFTHEDLRVNQGGVVAGTNSTELNSENHGTAVIGEISGDVNAFGITGICPDATISAVAFSMPTAQAIRTAADRLQPGDIMLLEIHRAGPRLNFQARQDQQGYVAIEWWPDDYEAIRYAVNKGIIVVEAAGNGRENLDDAIYDRNPSPPFGPFPGWWRNPYRRDQLDSGAVVVGAGAPPPGTHGRNHGPDRSRLDFSNFGALIDAQGWGREVTTTGYGDLQGGTSRDRWYTDTFSGTSSASPIVVGALGCVQGILRSRNRVPLSPARARELLRATGSPQQDAPGRPRTQRIGTRPNLRQLVERALETRTWKGVQFTGTLNANQTRRWFTHSWPAHWHVLWTAVPTTPRPGAPQIRWKVMVERASDAHITYWIDITNLTGLPVNVEARYIVLGW
jgi:hypothetical protein